MIGILTLLAFTLGNKLYGLEVARTMAFVAIGSLELVHSFNIKSEESIFKIGFTENKYLMRSLYIRNTYANNSSSNSRSCKYV